MKVFGLVLKDGERGKLHELCVKEGIPILFPEMFEEKHPMKYLWAFNIKGIAGASTILMLHFTIDGIRIIHGVKELEEFFSTEEWTKHKKQK